MAVPTDAILVYGARLYYSSDGGSNYNELADMKSIGVPATDTPDVDVTPLADSDDFRQFRLALSVAGEMDCKQFFNKTRFAALDTLKRQRLKWRLRVPDSATVANQSKLEWDGWLKAPTLDPFTDPDEPVLISFKVKTTGKITYTQGS